MPKRLLSTLTVLLFVLPAVAAVQPLYQPEQHFVNLSGNPCAGCRLFSFSAGTTTPLATYTDSTGTIQNPNPVVLDASGSASIWMGAASYKFVLADTNGTTLWTVDNVTSPVSASSLNFLPLTGGTLTGTLTAPYYQFTSAANQCGSGLYVSGWNGSGWICGTPALTGAAAGDLSGTYPSPTVAKVNGGSVPASATLLGSNSSGQLISQTGTIANSTTGNAATATAFAAAPSQCTSGQYATGISANGTPNCSVPTPNGTTYFFTLPNCSPGSSDGTGDGNLATCWSTLTLASVGIPTQPDTNYYVVCTANTSSLFPGSDNWALGAIVTTGIKTTTTVQYGYVVGKGASDRYPYDITADCELHHP